MRKTLTVLFSLIILFVSCQNNESDCSSYYCDQDCPNRTGALCHDGTKSGSTGRGTCSHHGGVSKWICDPDFGQEENSD